MISRRISTITFVATLACAASLAVRQVHAQQSAPKPLPTVALISSDENVITSLFEAKLLAGNQATWLERNEIKRLLEEQKLDAAFGAATPVVPKRISPADPASRYTSAHGGQAQFCYATN